MRKPLPYFAVILSLPMVGCEPPAQGVLEDCRKIAEQRASGHGLTATDVGELMEACMSERGYLLHKQDKACSHDLSSQSQRRCYYPKTLWGRIHRKVTAD